jgi:hypothetical protein
VKCWASGVTCRVAGFSFSSLCGESGILALYGAVRSLAVRVSGGCWASMLCGEGSLLVPAD